MTTILCIRKDNRVVMAGDGQATLGESVVFKSHSIKVRRIGNGQIIAGFAGAAADGITLIERLEAKLEKHANQLKRAAVELAKDWRMDKYLRQLQAFMIVADKDTSLVISGTGDHFHAFRQIQLLRDLRQQRSHHLITLIHLRQLLQAYAADLTHFLRPTAVLHIKQ